MSKRIYAAIGGLALIIISLYIYSYLLNADLVASELDINFTTQLPAVNQCAHIERIDISSRTMSESESQTLNAILSNYYDEECEINVSLYALNFDILPAETIHKIIPANNTTTATWSISPKKTGTYELVVSLDDESSKIGIIVTDVLGMTPSEARLVSYIAAFMGTVLTMPWFYDILKKLSGHIKQKG